MVTTLGSSAVLIPLVVVSGLVWRLARRTWAPLVLLAAAYAAAELLFQALKLLVGRPRPPAGLWIGHFTGLAFPSGHATLSAAVFGTGAALLAPATRRAAARAGAALLTLAVGLSRLYLAAHWLTDVLAGWVLGAVCGAGVVLIHRRWRAAGGGSAGGGSAGAEQVLPVLQLGPDLSSRQ